MSVVQYSGALPAKKKGELVEIAEKMSLDTNGTKEDMIQRITRYMDEHDLTDNPAFSGLVQVRKKSTRKDTNSSSLIHKSITSEDETAVVKRKGSARRKQTPPMIQSPELEGAPATITAPPSPIRKLITNVENAMPSSQAIVKAAEKTGFQLQARAQNALGRSRKFMSNATNIASVNVFVELLFLVYVMIPWQYYELPVNKPGSSEPATIPYAPLAYLLSAHMYTQLVTWAIPTILVPQIVGALISFTTPPKDIDPLSAGIVKLVLAVVMDDSWFAVGGRLISEWRIAGAATSLAFALAEATEERRVVMREHHDDH